jgi:hypothetical protein
MVGFVVGIAIWFNHIANADNVRLTATVPPRHLYINVQTPAYMPYSAGSACLQNCSIVPSGLNVMEIKSDASIQN